MISEYDRIDAQLYDYRYGIRTYNYEKAIELWESIREDKDILNWAISISKNKFGEEKVSGATICDFILTDYENVDKEIYGKLINLIFTDVRVARTVIDGHSNGGFSFLLYALMNQDLILTEDKKKYAVSEAMNKIGTVKSKIEQEEIEKELDSKGITDQLVTKFDIDGQEILCGAKTANMYMNHIFTTISSTQAHGDGDFDIRYHILKNPNWTMEEKKKLIMDFWAEDEEYDETLEQWEWDIVNDEANYKGNMLPQLGKDILYDYSYRDLLDFYEDEATTNRIWKEIEFCRKMHELRPQQWELGYEYIKK